MPKSTHISTLFCAVAIAAFAGGCAMQEKKEEQNLRDARELRHCRGRHSDASKRKEAG